MSVQYKGILKAIPTRYPGYGIKLPFAFGGAVSSAVPNGRAVVTRASYEEDGSNCVTVVAAASDIVFGEVRVENENETSDPLMQAWRDERYTAFLTEAALPINLTPEGFARVSQKYWEVLTTWKLRPTSNFFTGTDFASYPRVNRSRTPLPRLLSFIGSTTGPQDNIAFKYPIRVEVKVSSGDWVLADEFDQLTIYDDGLIEIPGLRLFPLSIDSTGAAKPGSWRWTSTEFATSGGQLQITPQPIRLTVAIPADARLTASVALANHAIGGADFAGVMHDMPDADRIAKRYRRMHYLDLGRLYSLWLQYQAYPTPQSMGGTAQTKATFATALRNDLPQLQSHARRVLYELGRLAKRGRLIFDGNLVTSLKPGTPIESLVPLGMDDGAVPDFPIRSVVDELYAFSDGSTVRTEVTLK